SFFAHFVSESNLSIILTCALSFPFFFFFKTSSFLSWLLESFALVKGAVLLLEEGQGVGLHEQTSPTATSPGKQVGRASDTQHRHIHAMLEQLRPEDNIQLAVQLESVNPTRVRYLIMVSTLGSKQESILLGMDFPNSDRCVDTQVYLDGDGGFSVTSAEETRIFKPVSMQTMW
uniref:Slingshot N-terminal domain-containing protein n=1 Tax=Scophthalmus maximus TaxID=52904 RepID=A0A8D3EFX3_SCOMX